jgi:hypothetical protein
LNNKRIKILDNYYEMKIDRNAKKKQIEHIQTTNKKCKKNNQIISIEAKLENFKLEPNKTYKH